MFTLADWAVMWFSSSSSLPPPPTSPLPLTSLTYLLPLIKILQGGNTEGGKRKVGEEDRKAYFKKGWFPSNHWQSTVLPLWPCTHCASAAAQKHVRNWPAEELEDGPLPAETWKRNSPLLAQMSHRKDLPGKDFFEFCCHTGASENTWHGWIDSKEKFTFSGLGSEQGCK